MHTDTAFQVALGLPFSRKGWLKCAWSQTLWLEGKTEHASVAIINEVKKGALASAVIKLETIESFHNESLSFLGLATLRSGKKPVGQEMQLCQW